MSRRYYYLCIALWIITVNMDSKFALVQGQSPSDTATYGNYLFQLFTSESNHTAAEQACKDRDAFLVRIKNQDIHEVIESLISSHGNHEYWIGLKDRDSNGTWYWSDGTDINTWSNWSNDEGEGDRGDCAMMRKSTNQWHDVGCNGDRRLICQSRPCNPNTCLGNSPKKYCSLKKTPPYFSCTCTPAYEGDSCTVNATILSLSSNSTFSPITRGPNRIDCVAEGNPAPHVHWLRNDVNISMNPSQSVYQTSSLSNASLYIGNAKLEDEGSYTCQAVNYVNKGRIVTSDMRVFHLSVYGAPEIVESEVINCSTRAMAIITWKPNNQTRRITHSIKISPVNETNQPISKRVDPDGNSKMIYSLSHLSSSTTYTIEIFVCPDECMSKLKDSVTITTGIGLPGSVVNATIQWNKNSSTCDVTWVHPYNIPRDQVAGLQIKSSSNFIHYLGTEPQPSEQTIYLETNQNRFPTQPNRNYTIMIRARTCAGFGPFTAASGSCVTEAAAPLFVPQSTVSAQQSRQTRILNIALPDESNGIISCVFVIVKLGEVPVIRSSLEVQDLKQLEDVARSATSDSAEYLAIAIPRKNLTRNHTIWVLGDNTSSECSVISQIIQLRRRTRTTAEPNVVKAHNWEIKFNIKYSYYTVTTTPEENGRIQFQISPVASFVNIKPNSTGSGSSTEIIVAVVVVILLILVISIVAVAYFIRNRKSEEEENCELENFPGSEPIYANLEAEDNQPRTKTDIPLGRLQSVYELFMADGQQKFKEQFQDLKSKAKEVTSPTEVASDAAVQAKNRYENILPYDKTRVHLSGEASKSYINACFVNGFKSQKKFIATQGPLPNTVDDFWKMVVEQKCSVIAMLTNCMENGKKKCEKYWPDRGNEMTSDTLKIINKDESDRGSFVKRTFIVKDGQNENVIKQFHFTNWPDHGVPIGTSSFFRLHKAVMKEKTKLPIIAFLECVSNWAGMTNDTFSNRITLNLEQKQNRSNFVSALELVALERSLDMTIWLKRVRTRIASMSLHVY